MQRHLHKCHIKYKNINKKVILTENQKRKRVEICKEWLKERINFLHVVMSDGFFKGWISLKIGVQ